ncbi:MAG TPA: hypothetical protein VKD22_11355, partial [Ramlibacter sp.]|nr:hypothetical protein [Ramlibacter sp.]
TIGYPLDNPVAYATPRAGSEWARTGNTEDAWLLGTDYWLEGEARWIPTTDTTVPVSATGWDGTSGWQAFLAWCWDGNAPHWYPDATATTYMSVHVVEPRGQAPSIEQSDGTRRAHLKLRSADGSAFTGY